MKLRKCSFVILGPDIGTVKRCAKTFTYINKDNFATLTKQSN